jgi:hypothetical protein
MYMTYDEWLKNDECPECIEENLEEDEDWDDHDNIYGKFPEEDGW